MKNETQFYLRDTRGDTGTSCMFWNKGGNGYGTNLDNAEIFTKEEAQRYADEKRHFIPLSKTEVDRLATIRVDCQYLDGSVHPATNEYVLVKEGKWDGNDVYFYTGSLGDDVRSPDMAKVYNYEDLHHYILKALIASKKYSIHYWPHIQSIKRRTIQAENINLRVMLQGSGIKYRSPRKQRPTTGKTRGNCSECGRIAWDYNCHEQPQCSDECLQKHIESARRGY